MEEEKEMELELDKVYALPDFEYIEYNGYCLAIAPELAKWIVLENNEQYEILNMFTEGFDIQTALARFEDNQEDVIAVLTQLEAKQIETSETRSIFSNTRLHLHLTNKCNLHCPHCYMNSGAALSNELTTDEIKMLCDEFKSCGGTDVSLTGGEPTSRMDFLEIAEYISSIGMKVSVFTNGFSWNENMVERFSKLNVEGVQISIDGYDEATNSTIRGKGVFRRALDTIDLFVKKHIYVKIAVTAPYEIIKEHQEEYISFSKALIEKYSTDAIEINYSYFFMPGRELVPDRISEIKDEYYNLVDKVVTSVYGNIEEDAFVSNLTDCIQDSCGYGGLNVMANGDFYFCDRIPDVNKSGNIRNMPFSRIYELMKIAEEAGKIINFKPCGDCELRFICGGGCRAEHFQTFTKIEDVKKIDFGSIPPRKCDKEHKEKFYRLMINTNERFFC
ncbi:radical SAM/SPASM domain-containing protein [Ruminococcus flavefaciens]|uniref:Radical SAM additional 4Fe4S-binding SPASM domain-containing protein n=1 Tax=Ruminococcus flavefaciens TaxID=1265 RepID=A0A1M7IGC3_RUMFL|nr:radical SAM protein [Ruminococcus flavefaciens]SHM39705.1 radical SAM additional 4Fe4S-binding SPASM domain-containing protein [Ruminococcus flavefaciens]